MLGVDVVIAEALGVNGIRPFSVVPLDAQYLYLVDADGVAAAALQILAFFRVMSSPTPRERDLLLQFARRQGRLHYVSYHFEAQPGQRSKIRFSQAC